MKTEVKAVFDFLQGMTEAGGVHLGVPDVERWQKSMEVFIMPGVEDYTRGEYQTSTVGVCDISVYFVARGAGTLELWDNVMAKAEEFCKSVVEDYTLGDRVAECGVQKMDFSPDLGLRGAVSAARVDLEVQGL